MNPMIFQGNSLILVIWITFITQMTIFSTGVAAAEEGLRTVNINTQFLRWPNPSKIPYYIDAAYSDDEKRQITAAIRKVTSDLSSCVGFLPVSPLTSTFKIKITPFQEDGRTAEEHCYSYPGYYKELQKKGKTEQRLVFARGAKGCFDGNIRSLLKYLAVLLGKRNEHQRADRNKYITLHQSALLNDHYGAVAYRLYTATEAHWSAFPYDYCSVTHNRPTDFAKPGESAFTVNEAPFFIPALGRLSNTDCQWISLLYPSCDRKKCEPLACANTTTHVSTTAASTTTTALVPLLTTGYDEPFIAPDIAPPTPPPVLEPVSTIQSLVCTTVEASTAATTVTGTPSLPVTSTATTSSTATQSPAPATPAAMIELPRMPCINGNFSSFCTKAPTASLLYQVGATAADDIYVLLSDNCAMKYKLGTDQAGNQALVAVVGAGKPNPVDIREIYPGYDGFDQNYPITFAYLSSANGPVYLSNSAAPQVAAACPFPSGSNPDQVSCDGSSWLTPPLPGSLSTSAPTPATVTAVPHDQFYVYIPGGSGSSSQICLSNTGRPTGPPPASQCLVLKMEIAKIVNVTAIQFISEAERVPALLVFGTDVTGTALLAMGDAALTPSFHPPRALTDFNTYGGAFPLPTYLSMCR